MTAWAERADGIVLAVRVTPRSSREVLRPGPQDCFAARINAPPVDGAANAAVVALIAKAFGVPKRDVTIISGETARMKRVAIDGEPQALARIAERLYEVAP